MEPICVFGDSICCGVVTDPVSGRYALCANTYAQTLRARGVTVRNMAQPGATSRDGLRRMLSFEPVSGAVCMIAFGGNDSDLNWTEVSLQPDVFHDAAVPLPEYRENLRRMILHARSCGMDPVVCIPIPVVYDRYFDFVSASRDRDAILKYLGHPDHIYRWQEQWAFAAQEIALENRCRVMNLRQPFLRERSWRDLMGPDGIHPNENGYRLLAREITAYFQ